MIYPEEFDDKNPIIQSLMRDVSLYKSTIDNLNLTVHLLQDRNYLLYNQYESLQKNLDHKTNTVMKFLEKHNFSIEDIEEFENEMKIDDRNTT